ncbi:hypothetical protein CAPTEDRAFT_203903 [Capitella teleta]|uniref:Uncharacterized protein n=1 Tax=Capitella teleta TaxID=283909 RepID=R7V462_CAPTE|nr:hypothetical protein CAPTEDRAFT_203903 [Capitella teleta]|eukprot:ELU10590.1 hypothetical protein CAPTEDRAFT_203903 [Capitella teleta]
MKVSSVMQESLVKLQAAAEEQRAPLIVKWPHDTECLHFSIFTGKVRPWCPLGRVIVTLTATQALVCPCSGNKHNCVHKAAVRCSLAMRDEEDDDSTKYPLTVGENIASEGRDDWMQFLMQQKIPSENIDIELDASVHFSPVVPEETVCPWCRDPLQLTCGKDCTIVDVHFLRKGRAGRISVSDIRDSTDIGGFQYYP